ncbi:hypothetical protein AB7849_15305 [Rhodanobacter sp. 115]|uniref:hypothetical protein n=1 Tax=Rhodanobacter sp. FW021-MT20 TaxID=1162282 RepID=UPI0034E4CEAE
MIVKNPIIKSSLIVFSFWYALLYVVSSIAYGWTGIVWLAMDYPVTLASLLVGCSLGAAGTLGVRALFLAKQEEITKGGSEVRGLRTSLGEVPSPGHAWGRADGKVAESFLAALHKRPWWALISREFPAHAAALDAVALAMASAPALPASPVPGGHGGRTLFEHSIAVADCIMHMARTWRYTGQRDKRGRVRVKLRDTDGSFHAFRRPDLGLLALTGFAHDFGKLVCYRPTGQKHGRTDLVREVQPNHDTEGAIALRSITEIMSLPYSDRRALLLAVGYYHHAGSIHNGDGITDRMRSLTELLIAADVATGKAEGGNTPDSYGDSYADDAEVYSTTSSSEIETPSQIGKGVQQRPAAKSQESPASGVAVAPADRISGEPPVESDGAQAELSLLFRMLADPSAIGARVPDRAKRIGWKYGGFLWLIDEAVKHQVAQLAKMDEATYFTDVLGVGANDRNGNASPFSTRLLAQLHGRGLLKVDWNGDELAPQRALFVVRGPKSTIGGIFLVQDSILATTKRLPDDQPMEIVRPLWGAGSAHKRKAEGTSVAPEEAQNSADGATAIDDGVASASTDTGAGGLVGNDEPVEFGDTSVGSHSAEGAGEASLEFAFREFIEAFPSDIEFAPDKEHPGATLAVVKKSKNEGAFLGLLSVVEAATAGGLDVSSVQMMRTPSGKPAVVIFPVPRDCSIPAPSP